MLLIPNFLRTPMIFPEVNDTRAVSNLLGHSCYMTSCEQTELYTLRIIPRI